MTVLETKKIETRDSWGHKGVATYERLTEWNDHGWQGDKHKSSWEKL